jgi:hypothetical protein
MLKSHWAEESQHAKIDAMTLRKLALTSTAELRKEAVQDYLDLLDALLGLLGDQATLDVKSLERALNKTFTDAERATLLEVQKKSYRQTFVTWGITNPMFVDTVENVFPEDAARIKAKAAELA